jgi:hypothetical protein
MESGRVFLKSGLKEITEFVQGLHVMLPSVAVLWRGIALEDAFSIR